MARARFVRPEFFTDEVIGQLSFGARILLMGIWCHADCRGVFRPSGRYLRAKIFPYKETVTSKEVDDWLNELADANVIGKFDAHGYVRNWLHWQRIGAAEVATGTELPEPPEWVEPAHWPRWRVAMAKRRQIASRYNSFKSALVARDGEVCSHCGATSDLHIDHIHPVSKGGDNDLANLQLLCADCNIRKSDRVGGNA